jgi:hypothetical protein
MASETEDYGIGGCYPWPLDSFPYRGLCSHSPLLEQVAGNFDLSDEQLEAMAAEIKERSRVYQAEYRAENPEYHRDYYQLEKARDPEKVKERQRKATERYIKKTDEVRAKRVRYVAKRKAEKKYFCDVCQLACSKPFEFARHNASKRHLNNVAKAEQGVVKKYHCAVCDYSCVKPSHLEMHNLGKRHLERVREAESSSRST